MISMNDTGSTETIVIGLEPDEMLLESIKEAVRKYDIQNGVVVSGVGTLKTCHLHFVTDTEFPPTDKFVMIEKPLELLSVSGIIADGEPHLHVVVSWEDKKVYAGHLEEKSEVLYLAEVAIVKFGVLKLTRRKDTKRHIALLAGKKG